MSLHLEDHTGCTLPYPKLSCALQEENQEDFPACGSLAKHNRLNIRLTQDQGPSLLPVELVMPPHMRLPNPCVFLSAKPFGQDSEFYQTLSTTGLSLLDPPLEKEGPID